jgi:hypothetical protein
MVKTAAVNHARPNKGGMRMNPERSVSRCRFNLVRMCMALSMVFFTLGCSKVYYSTMEKFGKEKRHILVDNVENVQDSQTKAQEEFKDALTRIKELYAFDGKELETFYKKVKNAYEDCDDRADQIEGRIADVKSVAKDLFKEWETEINQISDAKMKNSSRRSLKDARVKYARLETVMDASTRRMYPVLTKLKDYVLYLKHNLNAKAVGSLRAEVVSIEKEVAQLIEDMNVSIKEADNFINNF